MSENALKLIDEIQALAKRTADDARGYRHALEVIASYERDELLEYGEKTAVHLVEVARKALGREV